MPVDEEKSAVKPPNVPFRDALKFWIKLGFISFGGPAGQIAIMHKELVERRKWIDEDHFLHALNFCMLLPGPEAQQLAAYNGWRLHGIKGGIAAGAFFVLPSVLFLLVLSFIYARYGNVSEIAAVLDGFKPVVVAIVVEAVVKIGKRSLKSASHFAVAGLSFVAVQFFHVPFPVIVLGALLAGVLISRRVPLVPGETPNLVAAPPWSRLVKIVLVCFALWLGPLFAALAVYGRDSVAVKLYLFFTQAAFVTFGGAYAVLAYVNQAAVGAGWISAAQAVDGLALAETTPGPLIMVLQFIGFITGWQNTGGNEQVVYAAMCALLVTFATFLPSFLFVFSGAPYIERLQGNVRLSLALSLVTSAVVGVILNLSVIFGSAVFVTDAGINLFGIFMGILAFFALYFLKIDVLIIVAAGGLLGLLKLLFTA